MKNTPKGLSFESGQTLKQVFTKLKESDGFSLRQWAQILDLSPSYLNLVLNSQRLPSQKRLQVLADSLGMDSLAMTDLKKSHARDWLRSKGLADQGLSEDKKILQTVEEISDGDSVLMKSWLHSALLEFSTCENFQEDKEILADFFGVHITTIAEVLKELEDSGFLVRKNGVLKKKSPRMRIPTTRSRKVMRDFYIKLFKKAAQVMQVQTDKAAFDRRLISGYTVAVNPKNISEAKAILERAMLEAAAKLSEGACTEVYQLQFQFFTLMNSVAKN